VLRDASRLSPSSAGSKAKLLHPMPLVKAWAIFISHIWAFLCKGTSPRLCPFIPELKLWVFWAPIFISIATL